MTKKSPPPVSEAVTDHQIAAAPERGSIVLWESGTPPDGYKSRRNGVAARKVVDELYEERGIYSKVINRLKSHESLPEPARKLALQIANACLWEDEEKEEAGK